MSGPRGASFQPHPGATDSFGPLSWRALAAGQDGFEECGGLPLDFAGRGAKFRPRQACARRKGLEFGSRQPSAAGAGHSFEHPAAGCIAEFKGGSACSGVRAPERAICHRMDLALHPRTPPAQSAGGWSRLTVRQAKTEHPEAAGFECGNQTQLWTADCFDLFEL